MEGLNKVMLLGNLGADPELSVTQGGQSILKLRLVTTESYLDSNDAPKERTEWHSVLVWGKRGESLSRFLAKGSRVFIEGSVRTSSYEKKGDKRYRTEVVAHKIVLMGSRDSSPGGAGSGPPRERKGRPSREEHAEEEEIPF